MGRTKSSNRERPKLVFRNGRPKNTTIFNIILSTWILCLMILKVESKGTDKIEIISTQFDNSINKFYYFENSNNILASESKSKALFISEDEGKTWEKNDAIKNVDNIYMHPFDNEKAIVTTNDKKQFFTADKGKTWSNFEVENPPSSKSYVFSFHATNPSYVLYLASTCKSDAKNCKDKAFYTLDFFKTKPREFISGVKSCSWGRSTTQLTSVPNQIIFCIKIENHTADLANSIQESKLVWSENFFDDKNYVDFDFDGKPDGGVVGFTITEKFIVAAVKMDFKSEKLNLFVSLEGKIWAETKVPEHESLTHNAFTILDSMSHSLALDVVFTSSDKFGTLYTSNSNGTYFTKSLAYTNRDHFGIIDFERVKGMEHVLISNIVKNFKDVEKSDSSAAKQLQTQISYSNGADWGYLTPPAKDCSSKAYKCTESKARIEECALHLHSVSSPHNIGPLFSRISTPGLFIGVGNVGSELKDHEEGDTFLSRDGGLTWTCARPGPHKYTLGDMGALLVLVKESDKVDKIVYSYDQGAHWNEADLPEPIKPFYLTSEKSSTSQVALVFGEKKDGKHAAYYVDFTKFHSRKCDLDVKHPEKSKDFEKWQPKRPVKGDKKGDDLCIMGHKTAYYRRKPEVECYIGEKFKLPETEVENCACHEADFECDYGFIKDKNDKCTLEGKEMLPKGACIKDEKTYLASSGYRLIPGNTCDVEKKESKKLDEPVKKDCNGASQPSKTPEKNKNDKPSGNSKKIHHQRKEFSSTVKDYYIFPNSESIMLWTIDGEIWSSSDAGGSWKKKLNSNKVYRTFVNPYDPKRIYLATDDSKLVFTSDSGKSFDTLTLPLPISTLNIPDEMTFYPNKTDTFIFASTTECPGCHYEAFLTKNHGKKWTSIAKYINQCEFGKTSQFSLAQDKEGIVCSKYRNPDNNFDIRKLSSKPNDPNYAMDLVLFDNNCKEVKVLLNDIGQFHISGSHLIVQQYSKDEVNVVLSKDGITFSKATFPPDLQLIKESFAVHDFENSGLDSIYLTMEKVSFENTTAPTFGSSQLPLGSYFVSDSNFTQFSLSLPDVHVDKNLRVDLEAIQGVDGIIVANQVTSIDMNGNPVSETSISFDNGASWNQLTPPKVSIDGKDYNCDKGKCALHIHTYFTKRRGNKLGENQAAGRLIAVGNVGTYLNSYEDCRTYASDDAGLTWKEVSGSETFYAIGDSGNIFVLVDDELPTNVLQYSLDSGKTWDKYTFSNDPIRAANLITTTDGTSTRFLIIGFSTSHNSPLSSDKHSSEIISIDFHDLFTKKCSFDSKDKKKSDFVKWSPQRPITILDGFNGKNKTDCLLGKKVTMWRKKPDVTCYVGKDSKPHGIDFETCECSELDYECEFNFWRSEASHGKCVLYGKGPDRPKDCKVGSKYKARSGYRKIASSMCKGGVDLTQKIEKECLEINGVDIQQTIFEHDVKQNFYFRRSLTLLLLDEMGEVFISPNEGLSFHKLLPKDHNKATMMVHHPYIDDSAYFLTNSETHYLTHNEGNSLVMFQTPTKPNPFGIPPLSYHPEESGWLIFIGAQSCEPAYNVDCKAIAYLSKDNGSTWNKFAEYVKGCSFARTDKFTAAPKARIICQKYTRTSGSQSSLINKSTSLDYSDDEFKSSKTLFSDVNEYSMFYEFMVVAIPSKDGNGITLQISKDGTNFAKAYYPHNLDISHDGFTVLESDTHALFLHVTTDSKLNQEAGPLLISNSNGTYFNLALDNLNRNELGFVDFEKMAGIDGIAIANQVSNMDSVQLGKPKLIQSKITFDNGGTWKPLKVTGKMVDGKNYICDGDQCALHLHSFTERSDPENIFSIPAAVGLMAGVGNYGKGLTIYKDSDTYLTNDAGANWIQIRKGPYRHEFGDSGGIVLLAKDLEPINSVLYSTDMGTTFQSLHLGSQITKLKVRETSIEPQSTSSKFLLMGMTDGPKSKFTVVYLDFTGLHPRKCKLNVDNFNDSDFEKWNPGLITRNEKCFFGRDVEYFRRKRSTQCYVGKKYMDPVKQITNCSCTKADFECDYNFIRNSNGDCILVDGLQPLKSSCENGEASYTVSTGYRKIPISSCQGGLQLDFKPENWCPGRGMSFWSLLFLVLLPLSGLGFLLYTIIRKGYRRPIAWDRYWKNILPYLCFLPNHLITLVTGNGEDGGLLQRLRQNVYRAQGYNPVAQYDYDLEEDYIDGPVPVQLDEYESFPGVDTELEGDFDDEDRF